MDRRTFLKASIALGSGKILANDGPTRALASIGAPLSLSEPALPDPRVVDDLVRSMDRRLNWIDSQREFPLNLKVTPRLNGAGDLTRLEQEGRLFRQSIRTLYMTGRFMDLPDEIKTHPDIQKRIIEAQPEMDEAVFGVTDMLEGLQAADHRQIQENLKRYPIGESLAVLLDETAREDDFPSERRLDTRASTIDLAQRMSAQSPALTIDPYVDRVRKIQAHSSTARQNDRILAARVGEKVFWADQERLARLQAQWEKRLGQGSSSYDAAQPDTSAYAAADTTGTPKTKVSSGGRIMGFGAASMGAALIFAGLYSVGIEIAAIPAVFLGVTVGPILLIVGLIVLIAH